MRTEQNRVGTTALVLVLSGLGLTGCTEYTIETTVNPDGSGSRQERIEVSENDDVTVSPPDFLAVMHTTEEEGWSHRVEVDPDGDTLQVFERQLPVGDLASWSRLSGSFKLDGTTPENAQRRLGYVTMGDVRLRNVLRVGRGEASDGTMTFSYRETFSWDQGVDALVEFFIGEVDRALADRYPRLSEGERGQIVGFTRARYWMSVDEVLLGDDSEQDQLLSEVAQGTAEQAVKILRVRYPAETEGALEELLKEVLLDDDRLLTLLGEMPGLDLAFNANIVFRLNLPGTVTDSNAHKRDGTTLVWKFGPGDALETPVEIHAESVAGR
jgi:hypothetical protein